MSKSNRKLAPVVNPGADPQPLPPLPAPRKSTRAARETKDATAAALDAVTVPEADAADDTAEDAPEEGRISQPPGRARKTSVRMPRPMMDLDGTPVPQKPRKTPKTTQKVTAERTRAQAALAPVTRRRELLGLTLVSLGVLTVMSLWSYRPGDGPWAVPPRPTHNWVGPVGAMLADGLIGLLGLGSHVMAVGMLLMGALCFMRRPPVPSRVQVAGAVLTLLNAAIISHLALKGAAVVPYAPGGLLGALCGDGLARLFSAPGTAVIAGAGFAAGVVLCTDLSLTSLVRALVGVLDNAAEIWRAHREVAREKKALRKQMEEDAKLVMLQAAAEEEQRQAAEKADRAEKRKQSARLKAEMALEREAREAADEAAQAMEAQSEPAAPTAAGEGEASAEPAAMVVSPTAQDVSPAQTSAEPAIAGPSSTATANSAGPSLALMKLEVPASAVPEVVAQPAAPAAPEAALEPRIVEFIPRAKNIEDKVNNAKDERPKPFGTAFELPPLNMLDYKQEEEFVIDREALNENARTLIKTFKDFGIDGTVKEIRPGPVVTTYEFTPAAGVRVGKIAGMADDLAMALEAMSVRIVAPIPGKNAVGIEIPNNRRQNVYLKELFAHPDFQRAKSKLTLALGKDIEGKPFMADLAKMPHVLIAGTTGSGKSVSVNGMILSILYKATPDDVRMLMIDPKMLELKLYDGIPHLLLPPVTDPKKAAMALRWAVEEMERRYQLLADFSVRDIATFNKKMEHLRDRQKRMAEQAAAAALPGESQLPIMSGEDVGVVVEEENDTYENDQKAIERNNNAVPDKLPFIVVVVDEFADLMMVASKDVETYVARLAQKARACGIHVMLATQRPSVDVITGVIKANFPTRMSFKVASSHDSKTIINSVGANRLLGNGDMLMIPPGSSDLMRIHGGYVSETEISRVVGFWKAQGKPQYNEAILRAPEDEEGAHAANDEPYDEFYDQAVEIVAKTRKVSISEIQRKLGVGYNRAAKMVERMEVDGLIGLSQGANKPREVYVRPKDE